MWRAPGTCTSGACGWPANTRTGAARCSPRPGSPSAPGGRAGFDDAEAHLLPWLEWCRGRDGDPGTAFVLAELGFLAELRGDAPDARRRHLDGFAAARATGDPRAVALALEGLAGAQALAGRFTSTARLLGAAAELRAAAGAPQPVAERGDVARSTAAARRGLGEAAFEAAYASGAGLAPDVLVTEVGAETAETEVMGKSAGTESLGVVTSTASP